MPTDVSGQLLEVVVAPNTGTAVASTLNEVVVSPISVSTAVPGAMLETVVSSVPPGTNVASTVLEVVVKNFPVKVPGVLLEVVVPQPQPMSVSGAMLEVVVPDDEFSIIGSMLEVVVPDTPVVVTPRDHPPVAGGVVDIGKTQGAVFDRGPGNPFWVVVSIS